MRYKPWLGAWLKEAASVTYNTASLVSDKVPNRIGHIGAADITHWQRYG
jgi:hypothetical protein